MYFSLDVKTRREDFFDMERGLKTLKQELLDPATRMIVIKGLRRSGKSSLMRVALSLVKVPHIFIDPRSAGPPTPESIYECFSSEFSRFLNDTGLRKAISMIRGVEVSGLRLEFMERRLDIISRLLEEMGKKARRGGLILAIDEAQELRSIRGFANILAHIYDYLRGVKILLAGSEVGLLDKLLGVGDPRAPLFGRAFSEIRMERLSREKSLLFLRRGFEQLGLQVPEEEMERAVYRLDGVIGWLTYYGHLRSRGDQEALEKAVDDGAKLAAAEFQQFLTLRPLARRRYIEAAKNLTSPSSWSDIKRALRRISSVSDKQISSYLRELVNCGFVEKRGELYSLADPLLTEAAKRGYV